MGRFPVRVTDLQTSLSLLLLQTLKVSLPEGDGVLLTGTASDMSCEIRSARVHDERRQIDR